MHELSITQSVVDIVSERTGTAKVSVVHLRIGKLSGVVPDSVRFCFDLITEGTALEGARLVVDEPAGSGRCRECGQDFALSTLILLCPCGSADVSITDGQQLGIVSVEVA